MAKKKIVPKKENRNPLQRSNKGEILLPTVISEDTLYKELSYLIEESKQKVVSQVKSTVNILFWQIGKKINDEILHNKRAEYGAQIVSNLAARLTAQYGRSFELKNLHRMMQFAEQFPDRKIVVTLSRQLSWSHFITIIPLKTIESRLFYAHLATQDIISVRELRRQIATKTFERTQLANTRISKKSKIPKNTFKDPYMLDFFDLQNAYLEKDFEDAILRDLEIPGKISRSDETVS